MLYVSAGIREALNGGGLNLPGTALPRPNAAWKDPVAVEAIETIRAVTTRIRNLRAERGLPQTEVLDIRLEVPESPLSKQLQDHVLLLRYLARLGAIEIREKTNAEKISANGNT